MTQHTFPFQFVANDLSLDLVNTRINAEAAIHDLIETPSQLAQWLQEVGLNCPVDTWTKVEFAKLHQLRDALAQVSNAVIEHTEVNPDAIALINTHLLNHRSDLRLSKNTHGFQVSKRDLPLSASALMGLIAFTAAEMFASTDSKRLKVCAHTDCVLVFKDISKSGKRRWCSMDTCGNRSKVAAFRSSGEGR
ncbi:CGNR zinc finger domain-containing protein [Tateyamaria sp. SN3-11]|uniref:CGNR zinc finger domain-containing protein n=1 Tax=Tateyamaria sp. SN3-11 TaxID=3092147 RepID=UPI0039ED3CA8